MTEFEKRAKVAMPYFNRHIRYGKNIIPPPFIVELLGSPSGGKSILIKELDKFFRRQGFRVLCPQEGAEAIRYLDRTTYFYNMSTGHYAFRILMEESEGHKYDFIIFERCVFDAYTWMKYWHKKGQLSREMCSILQNSFLVGMERIDCAFFLICDPDVAVKRETRNEISSQLGSSTNPESIEFLINCNKESYEELKDRAPDLFLVNTSYLSEKEMVQKVTADILGVLEKKIVSFNHQ